MKVVNKEVECVCYFFNRNMEPVRIRLIGESGGDIVINIDRKQCTLRKLEGEEFLIYNCQAIINNEEKAFELRYNKKETKWILYKI